jgi:hypothetical protein
MTATIAGAPVDFTPMQALRLAFRAADVHVNEKALAWVLRALRKHARREPDRLFQSLAQ